MSEGAKGPRSRVLPRSGWFGRGRPSGFPRHIASGVSEPYFGILAPPDGSLDQVSLTPAADDSVLVTYQH